MIIHEDLRIHNNFLQNYFKEVFQILDENNKILNCYIGEKNEEIYLHKYLMDEKKLIELCLDKYPEMKNESKAEILELVIDKYPELREWEEYNLEINDILIEKKDGSHNFIEREDLLNNYRSIDGSKINENIFELDNSLNFEM